MDASEIPVNAAQLHVLEKGMVARGEPIELNEVAVLLHPNDDVAIARIPLNRGVILRLPDGSSHEHQLVEVTQRILSGHKVSLRALVEGSPVLRYGAIIGFATRTIQPGEHVHSHNISVGELKQTYAYGIDLQPVVSVPVEQRRTFMGYQRPDGSVGTRNYVAIISSVNCSASTVRLLQQRFGPEIMRAYPNIDGVIGLTHKSGCGMQTGSKAVEQLQRVLAGMAAHPNIGAYLLVGLGCESNQLQDLINSMQLDQDANWKKPYFLTLQENRGIAHTVDEGAKIIAALLPQVNAVQREALPISAIKLALQCGGSDGWSGVTANPALGCCVDELVRQGGTAVLSETPEIYGAEHILLRRARSREIGEKFVARLRWWEHYTAINDMEMNNNPTPGNKLGGLTTIYEKSLGAIAKGGTTPLNAVYNYAEAVTERGLVIMDTPGYDPVSATGQVAGGCNLIVFTTGRGSMFGFKPAPSIKVSSNTALYQNLQSDIDLDAGVILNGISIQEVGRRILEEVIAVASGKQSKSEAQGIGEEEFAPWILGATM